MACITPDRVSREVRGQWILDGPSFDGAEGEFIGLIGCW
ncbi:MAG: hypothetical protein ACI88C_003287 [Acidimicrobiales bacterium]|jgi:ABC-type polysaccharide/polyol phosphate transport system ATPase subunit